VPSPNSPRRLFRRRAPRTTQRGNQRSPSTAVLRSGRQPPGPARHRGPGVAGWTGPHWAGPPVFWARRSRSLSFPARGSPFSGSTPVIDAITSSGQSLTQPILGPAKKPADYRERRHVSPWPWRDILSQGPGGGLCEIRVARRAPPGPETEHAGASNRRRGASPPLLDVREDAV
jgi:hypothetical protein